MLQNRVHEALARHDIALMTHLVLGHPSFEANRRVVARMVAAGVNVIELQIPFSEPVADGPVIARACQESIAHGTTVAACLDFAAAMAAAHPKIPFLLMTYYNIVFRLGEEAFLNRARWAHVRGLIVPDLPLEEGADFYKAARRIGIDPILIFAPTTTDARMHELEAAADGFIYCVARRGVTGAATAFGPALDAYLARCRAATDLPLAVGFGIRSREDVDHLIGKADIAVIGSQTIRIAEERGPEAVGPFLEGLRG
ncbi:MAG TPA: tryptophan synthase subunit alpha [Candidatus Methanoperedens sp.]|nr:tryptophan synthase subunit alpha [Candidatus Methanoperedens sp.]